MTTTIQSTHENSWDELKAFLGTERYDQCIVKKIQKLASSLTFADIAKRPTRGQDGLNRPYFSIQVYHEPEFGYPLTLAVVMYFHDQKWKGRVTVQEENFDEFFGYEEKHALPDKGKEFIVKLFGGKYSDYRLNVEGDD